MYISATENFGSVYEDRFIMRKWSSKTCIVFEIYRQKNCSKINTWMNILYIFFPLISKLKNPKIDQCTEIIYIYILCVVDLPW